MIGLLKRMLIVVIVTVVLAEGIEYWAILAHTEIPAHHRPLDHVLHNPDDHAYLWYWLPHYRPAE